MCWYCKNGLPKEVQTIVDKYDRYELGLGPGHCVWDDCNFDDACIMSGIEECDKVESKENYSEELLVVIKQSLLELLAIAEDIRVPAGAREEWEKDRPQPATDASGGVDAISNDGIFILTNRIVLEAPEPDWEALADKFDKQWKEKEKE
jgi:hypothetical protein